MMCGGIFFSPKKTSIKKCFVLLCYLYLYLLCYYCSIDLEKQSGQSGLRPDTNSLVPFNYRLRNLVFVDKKRSIRKARVFTYNAVFKRTQWKNQGKYLLRRFFSSTKVNLKNDCTILNGFGRKVATE